MERLKSLILFLGLANTSSHLMSLTTSIHLFPRNVQHVLQNTELPFWYISLCVGYISIWSLAIFFIHRNLFFNFKNILKLISYLVNYYYKVYRIFHRVVFHDISHLLWLTMIFWPFHHCSHKGGDSGEGAPLPLKKRPSTQDYKLLPNLSPPTPNINFWIRACHILRRLRRKWRSG